MRRFVRPGSKPEDGGQAFVIAVFNGSNAKAGSADYDGEIGGYYNSELSWEFAKRENATWLNRKAAERICGMLRSVGYLTRIEEK